MNFFEADGRVENVRVYTTKTNKTFYVFDLINTEDSPYSKQPQVNKFPCIRWGAIRASAGDFVRITGKWVTKTGVSKAGKEFTTNQINCETVEVEKKIADATASQNEDQEFMDDIAF